jgi:feruloyl-CoA hydratase/lyase
MTGDTFDGKTAREIGFINRSVAKAELRDATIAFACRLMEKSPAAMRYTKEAIRAVRFMNEPQAQDYLAA